MNGPKYEKLIQEPSESEQWEEWEDFCLPEKSEEFHYSDSTEEHIGKSQHFHYEGNDLPEKE